MAKAVIPDSIQRDMKLWLMDLVPLPTSYVTFHRDLAEHALKGLVAEGLEVLSTEMQSDGWMDSMKVLSVRAIYHEGKREGIVYLQWHGGNQEFFVRSKSGGGSSPLRLFQMEA